MTFIAGSRESKEAGRSSSGVKIVFWDWEVLFVMAEVNLCVVPGNIITQWRYLTPFVVLVFGATKELVMFFKQADQACGRVKPSVGFEETWYNQDFVVCD